MGSNPTRLAANSCGSQQRLKPYEAEIRERFATYAGQPGIGFDLTCGLLGATSSTRTWHPRDGRITRLGLSRVVDASVGSDIILDYWWRPA